MGRQAKSGAADIIDRSDMLTVENDSLFHSLYEQPYMVWMVAPDAGGVWFNRFFFDYTGKTLEQMRDWAWQDFQPLEEIPRVSTGFYRALDTGEKWQDTYHMKAADGGFRLYHMQAAPLRDRKGKIVYWLGCGCDVSEAPAYARA